MHSRASGSDPLASVIQLLRPEAVLSKVVSGKGRWSVRFAAHVEPSFGLVLDGSCFLDLEGVGPTELGEGDFIVIPGGNPVLQGGEEAPPRCF